MKLTRSVWIVSLLVLGSGIFLYWLTQIRQSPDIVVPSRWDLSQFKPLTEVIEIEGIQSNLSGLTYHAPSDTLFGISNAPPEIYQLNKRGDLLRTIELSGFEDTESITYLFDDLFAIAEERRYNIVIVEINADSDHLRAEDATVISLRDDSPFNIGIEGIAWSEEYGLFIVKEFPPRVLLLSLHGYPQWDELESLGSGNFSARDFAGLAFIKGESQPLLLVLSQASHRLMLFDVQGRELSRLDMRGGFLQTDIWMRQPEGVAVDDEGHVYLVGEPNEFLVLKHQSPGLFE